LWLKTLLVDKMKLNKKGFVGGSIELSLIIYGLIFMLLLNISLGFVIDETLISSYDIEDNINDYVNDTLDLGILLGSAVTGLLWMVSVFFSIFGINFIAVITILPTWMTGLFILYNSLISFAIIMYFVDRLWLG